MPENMYLKIVQDDDDIIKWKTKKVPYHLKKIIFFYQSMFKKLTIKQQEGFTICILPVKQENLDKKIEIFIKKLSSNRFKKYKFVLPKQLMKKNIYFLLDKYHIDYYKGIEIKKYFLFNILEYINKLQNKKNYEREITILVNENSDTNLHIIKQLAKESKYIKIVSKNIYQFRKIENELYEKHGIALQFSNSYRKSLLKSELIVNIDFFESEVNEYEINHQAIIINLFKNIKIDTKLFNGIIINSFQINLKKDIKEKLKAYQEFDHLILYESMIKELDMKNVQEKIKLDKIIIKNLIGNNGVINKKEIKSLGVEVRRRKNIK